MAEPGATGVTVHGSTRTLGGAGAPAGSEPRASKPAKAFSIADLVITKSAVASRLRKDGEDFVNNVVEIASNQIFPMKITVIPVRGGNFEARVLDNGSYAYALIFHETFTRRSANTIPTDSVIREVVSQLQMVGCTSQLINCFVVTKDWYEKSEQIGKQIFNSFAAADPKYYEGHGIEMFNQPGKVLTVSSNMLEAIRYAETTTGGPIGFADSALLAYIKDTTNKGNEGGGIYGQGEPDRTDVLSVTWYTDFKTRYVAGNYGFGGFRIDPTVVITGIYSSIRTKEMAQLALALVADRAIFQKGWLNAFTTFSSTTTRNLGNLLKDQKTGKPTPCKSPADVNMVIQKNFLNPDGSLVVPYLALDLQEGADQFPGLREILSNPDLLKSEHAAFTGSTNANPFNITQGRILAYYDGLVDTPKGKVDTRGIDYMYLVDTANGGKLNPADVEFLLTDIDPSQDPTAPRKKIDYLEQNCYPGKIDCLYTTWRVFLNPQYVQGLLSDFASLIPLNWEDRVQNNAYDRSGLATFNIQNNVPQFAPVGGPGGFGGRLGFGY